MAQSDFIVKNGAVILNGLTATSTSTITGALVVQGGIGLSGNSTFGGNLNIVSTSVSTSSLTGALTVLGGVGFANDVNIGGTLKVQNVDLLKSDLHVFYVSEDGDDNASGKLPQSAVKSIRRGLELAGVVGENASVFILGGVYTEQFPLTVPAGVSVKGAGLRQVYVQPTTATNTSSAFLLNGETTISDFTVGGFYKPGFAFKYAPGAKITTRSPYVERFSVITRGSNPVAGDPYGYDSTDAGGGAYLDGALVDATSLEASFLFNEATFITPNATAVYVTNGTRVELLNGFSYFANKGIHYESGSAGWGGQGRTRLRLANTTGTFTVGHNLYYISSTGTVAASGVINEVTPEYVYLTGKASGFIEAQDRSGKVINVYGNVAMDSFQRKIGTASARFTTNGDLLNIVSDSDLQYGLNAYTLESWVYLDQNGIKQTLFNKGSAPSTTFGMYVGTDNKLVGQHGTTLFTATTALSTGTWYHLEMARDTFNTNRLFVNGVLEATVTATSSITNSDALEIGGNGLTPSISLKGYMDEIRVSSIARHTTTFTPQTTSFNSDVYTTVLIHADGATTSIDFKDDGQGAQNVYSTTGTYLAPVVASAQQITLADYRQFGGELRCIGSAACYGNYGIYADGEGIDIKAVAFNMSFIGSGKDFTNDPTLTVQGNEVVKLNGAKVYYQTVDQLGDFRVGDQFRINQRSGNVDFGTANFRLGPLSSLTISDGVNASVLQPTSIQVGSLLFASNRIQTISGNLVLDPSGTLTTIESDLQVNGSLNFTNQLFATSMDNAVSTTTGAIVVNGGVGIGKDLYVGGSATVVGNLTVKGTTTIVNSTQTSITDPVLDLGTNPDNSDVLINDGWDRGLLFHYNLSPVISTATYKRSFFGMDNVSETLIFKTGVALGPFSQIDPSFLSLGTWGGARFGTLKLESTNDSSGSASGSLISNGGAYFAKRVYSGANFYDVDGKLISTGTIPQYAVTALTAGTDTAVSTSTGQVRIWTTSTLQSVTSRGSSTNVVVSFTNTSQATSTVTGAVTIVGGLGVGGSVYASNIYSAGSLVVTEGSIGSLGITALYAGTDTSVSSQTGQVYVWNNSTLQTVTNRGFTTTNSINISNATASTSTTTGALTVAGGIGSTGDIYARNIYSNGAKTLTTETDTLQLVTERGATTNRAITFSNTSQATINGSQAAVQMSGGLYVAKRAYVTGEVTVGNGGVDSRAPLNVNGNGLLQSWNDSAGGLLDLYFTGTNSTGYFALNVNSQLGLAVGPNNVIKIAHGGSGNNFVGINVTTATAQLEVGGDIKANNIYANGSLVITNATLGTYGVTSITTASGGGIAVNTSTGNVIIQSIDDLNSITGRGNSTTNAITIGSLSIPSGNATIGNTLNVALTANLNTVNVSGVLNVTTSTNSAGTNSGAVIVAGGIGAGGSIFAGALYDQSQRVVTSVTPVGGTGISIRSGAVTIGTATSFTIDNTGVIAIQGSTYIGVNSGTGIVTITNLGVQTLTAGTDTAVSTSTGQVRIWTTSTLQSVTSRGATTDNAIRITNATASTATTNGALVVTGGVGIGGNLNVNGNTVINGNLQVFGNQTFVNSTQTYVIDPVIEIGTGVNGSLLGINDGYDRGLVFHYNTTNTSNTAYDNHSFLGMDNATRKFVYKTNIYPGGVENYTPAFSNTGTWGTARFGSLELVDATSATSTLTGALTIVGGAGIGGTVYIGQRLFVGGYEVLTSGSGGVGSYVSFITAGTDTAISTSTGAVTVWNTSTLQSITGRGAATTNAVSFTNTGNSTSTVAGNAVQVSGGVGVAGDVYIQGNVYSQGGAPLYTPRVTVSLTPPTTATNRVGDFWIDPSIGVEYQWIWSGSRFYWIQFTGAM
jgi:hypothetical protein